MEAQHSANGSGAAPAQRSSLGSNKPPAKKLTISLKKGLSSARPRVHSLRARRPHRITPKTMDARTMRGSNPCCWLPAQCAVC